MTIDFRAEVDQYDREAQTSTMPGPRHRMTYRVLGEGPPLILVPGLASTYRGYAPTLRRLAERFRTIQVDYPGEHPDDGVDLAAIGHDELVDDLFRLSDHLKLDSPGLFGLSFGSTLSLAALHRDPVRFGKAVLQGGFANRRFQLAERIALRVGRRFHGKLSSLPFHKRGLASRSRATFPAGNADLWDFYVEENGLTTIAGLTHRLDIVRKLDLFPILPEIRTPILLIHGTADEIVPVDRYHELARMLPAVRGVLMPGVGHQPHFTHPEELAKLVGDFLA